MITLASQHINELASEIAENQTVKDIATSAGPTVVGTTVTVLTGNPVLGSASSAVASALAKKVPDGFTRVAASVGLSFGFTLLSFVATPVILGLAGYEGAKYLWPKLD
jgi:hypothetical protein